MAAEHQDEVLLDAALRTFGQYGCAKTTIQDIARAAGVSRATLYTRFATKEELSRAGARRVLARAVEQARSALAATAGRDVIDRVDTAAAANSGALLSRPDRPGPGR